MLEATILYVTMHWQELLGALYGVLAIINGFLPDSSKKTWLGKFMNFISPFTRKDAPNTFKSPLSNGPKAKEADVINKLNLVPVLALVMAGLTACSFCQKVENKGTLRCKIESSIVQCGPGAAAALVSAIPYIVAKDWTGLLAMLGNDYPAVQACVEDVIRLQLKPADASQFEKARAARHGH